jgi:hypothetical protein
MRLSAMRATAGSMDTYYCRYYADGAEHKGKTEIYTGEAESR